MLGEPCRRHPVMFVFVAAGIVIAESNVASSALSSSSRDDRYHGGVNPSAIVPIFKAAVVSFC